MRKPRQEEWNKLYMAIGKAVFRYYKKRAISWVSLCVRRGDLCRLYTSDVLCQCGEKAYCYEHRDYSKPLEVEAVCDSCNALRGPAALPIDFVIAELNIYSPDRIYPTQPVLITAASPSSDE